MFIFACYVMRCLFCFGSHTFVIQYVSYDSMLRGRCYICFCFIVLGRPPPDVDEDLAERMSAMRRPGESDMDYFERRYQERVSSL